MNNQYIVISHLSKYKIFIFAFIVYAMTINTAYELRPSHFRALIYGSRYGKFYPFLFFILIFASFGYIFPIYSIIFRSSHCIYIKNGKLLFFNVPWRQIKLSEIAAANYQYSRVGIYALVPKINLEMRNRNIEKISVYSMTEAPEAIVEKINAALNK